MTRNLIGILLISSVILCLFTTTTCLPHLRKSCGSDLFERVARLCRKRGGYNRLEYFRGKRSITLECCLNACSDFELNLYCTGPKVSANDVEIYLETNEQ